MDTLKERYFIRIRDGKDEGEWIATRLPLCSKRTLLRVFIQFLMGDMHSLEIYTEEYFDRKVTCNERKNGVLVRGDGQTMRRKVIGDSHYDDYVTKFREGLFNPEQNGKYTGLNVGAKLNITHLDDEQFESSMELLTAIHEGTY